MRHLSVKSFVTHCQIDDAALDHHVEGVVIVAVRVLGVFCGINFFEDRARHLLEIASVPGMLAENNSAPRDEAVNDARRHQLLLRAKRKQPANPADFFAVWCVRRARRARVLRCKTNAAGSCSQAHGARML